MPSASSRSAASRVDGTYEFTRPKELPRSARVPLGGIVQVEVSFDFFTIRESVQVEAVVPSPIASTENAQNLRASEIASLPVGRTIFRVAELAPGLTNNGPNVGQLAINGAFSYDNVFLVDGVDVNDNIFGTNHNLFIEDAIEETQVLTSGISAEYGRFSGGVINTTTKSGSNNFSGSFRANLYKPDWTTRTPFEIDKDVERTGDLADNTTYESTIGGPLVEDRLWFFFANRVERVANAQAFDVTGISYADEQSNDRNQLKLTGTVAPGHRVEGSYMRNSTEQAGPTFTFTIDPAGLRTRQIPNDLLVATYRGVLTDRLFGELQVSRKTFGFRNSGGTATDIVESPFITLTQRLGHYNAPYFDANDPQSRDNRQVTGSATYVLQTHRVGTHSLKTGFEFYNSALVGGNSQTATGFVFDADYVVDGEGAPVRDRDDMLVPVFVPGLSLIETWRPTRGARLDINTQSFYVNDSWSLGTRLSFNLGLRAEKVDSEATGNISSVDTAAVVPRLAAAFDPIGDGRFILQTTYGHYAGKYNEAQFSRNTSVGTPDLLVGLYTGPAGQGRDFEPGFDPDNYQTVQGIFPVKNVFFGDDLKSPLTREFTVSAGATLGRRGYLKTVFIRRTTTDFVEDFFTLDGGATTIIDGGSNFGTFQNQIFRNTTALGRTYQGLQFMGRAQVTRALVVDVSWTVQLKNEGNFVGELTNQPAISSDFGNWPEITPENRYYPTGRLPGFQRHKVRLWGVYNLSLGDAGVVDIGALWRYDSGRTYSLVATNTTLTLSQALTIGQLGYASGPSPRDLYFLDGRGSGNFVGHGLLDLSFQYRIPVWGALNPWLKAEVYNVLNNDTAISWNTTVRPDVSGPVDELGLPTTYVEGPQFGEPTSADDYPQYLPGLDGLRTFRFALGFRF